MELTEFEKRQQIRRKNELLARLDSLFEGVEPTDEARAFASKKVITEMTNREKL